MAEVDGDVFAQQEEPAGVAVGVEVGGGAVEESDRVVEVAGVLDGFRGGDQQGWGLAPAVDRQGLVEQGLGLGKAALGAAEGGFEGEDAGFVEEAGVVGGAGVPELAGGVLRPVGASEVTAGKEGAGDVGLGVALQARAPALGAGDVGGDEDGELGKLQGALGAVAGGFDAPVAEQLAEGGVVEVGIADHQGAAGRAGEGLDAVP